MAETKEKISLSEQITKQSSRTSDTVSDRIGTPRSGDQRVGQAKCSESDSKDNGVKVIDLLESRWLYNVLLLLITVASFASRFLYIDLPPWVWYVITTGRNFFILNGSDRDPIEKQH